MSLRHACSLTQARIYHRADWAGVRGPLTSRGPPSSAFFVILPL